MNRNKINALMRKFCTENINTFIKMRDINLDLSAPAEQKLMKILGDENSKLLISYKYQIINALELVELDEIKTALIYGYNAGCKNRSKK